MLFYTKDELKSRLDDAARQGRLSHAVLFSGRRGAGRKFMARYLAQLFLCEKNGCGECATCKNIEAGAHPDVIFVKETIGGKYAMEKLRLILRDTVIKPNNGDIKIYVFEDCDEMMTQHQNALLKIIEEPPAHIRFIFTCENVDLIPITVLSRVTKYEVPDTEIADCKRCLMDEGCEEAEAARLSEMFSGNIGECKAVLSGGGETRLVDIAKKAGEGIAEKSGYKTAAALSEARDRDELSRVFGCLSGIIRDALALKAGGAAEAFDKKTSEKIAENLSGEEILALLDALFEISANEIYNLNAALQAAYFTAVFAR